MGRLPASVPRITTSRRVVFRGCRYFVMFRPPSLLTPQIVPTAAILPQGSRGFYVRAYRALLPPHAPDMLTVRRQVIDGTGTCTLLDSQPCRLLRFPTPPMRLVSGSASLLASCWHFVDKRPVVGRPKNDQMRARKVAWIRAPTRGAAPRPPCSVIC